MNRYCSNSWMSRWIRCIFKTHITTATFL